MELHLPFVEACQKHRAEVERPDPVVDLLETNPLARQRLAREDPFVLLSHQSVVSDLSRLEMAGVLDRRQ